MLTSFCFFRLTGADPDAAGAVAGAAGAAGAGGAVAGRGGTEGDSGTGEAGTPTPRTAGLGAVCTADGGSVGGV
jgi:hypothetical protein